jgi:hypothetical protein
MSRTKQLGVWHNGARHARQAPQCRASGWRLRAKQADRGRATCPLCGQQVAVQLELIDGDPAPVIAEHGRRWVPRPMPH